MFQMKKILVVVDPRQETHHALPRAAELAAQVDAQLTLLCLVNEHSSPHAQELTGSQNPSNKRESIINFYQDHLETLGAAILPKHVSYTCEVHWSEHFLEGLFDYLETSKFDLLVKTSHQISPAKKILMTPTDWQLLREAPTNLLFVKQGNWPNKSNILAAINIAAEDSDHIKLNKKIINATMQLAKDFASTPHFINAFPWPAIELQHLKRLYAYKEFYQENKLRHRSATLEYLRDYEVDNESIHIAEGVDTDQAIPHIAKATEADLLVLGTVGRTGVNAAVYGNTSEKILDKLSCEVLAIK